ncbi:3-deoxy-D-manno-octulosonic acid kinase [Vibrio sp. SCSIO 43136]|uniref:3-deoxy-D-manno-octulosonic acid kinase n=1 Tax=Vibrio sp. SCSIO 43136 TaxID=2819101 RepID=UPI0020758FB1|nr:3-deoxy-D-manno-octulosonic acid kinase [Vibrio sp. SCSIO 43136]USD65172.1 3-deoxy-D-manno-octulosonic acid kinase [Vibrio sp. SCSIO 43136]
MFQTTKHANQTLWFNPDYIDAITPQHFEGQFWQASHKVVGSATGRGTTWFVQLDTIQAALRHYRRGGLFGKLVKDHYLWSGWENTRSYQELHLLAHLRQSGVNVPTPIAARAVKRVFCYQADILTEKIPNARDLVDILCDKALDGETYRAIGEQIRALHQAGVNHTDLNIHNILLDDQGRVWIIDFDKCYQQQGQDWQQGNLDRLLRSFNKERIKRQIQWCEQDFDSLMLGYNQE